MIEKWDEMKRFYFKNIAVFLFKADWQSIDWILTITLQKLLPKREAHFVK